MSELLTAARAALAELVAYHQSAIKRAEAALAALAPDEPPIDTVRPVEAKPTVPIVAPKAATQPAKREGTKYDRSEVAAVARAAHEAGGSMADAIATHFNITRNNADQLILITRKEGHDIPRVRPLATAAEPPAPRPSIMPEVNAPTGARVFACDECDAEFPTSNIEALSMHTLHKHSRRPSVQERSPVAARAGAA